MEVLDIYSVLNKKIKGLTSGFKSITHDGFNFTYEMIDGTKIPIKFPAPKDGDDGISIIDLDIRKIGDYHYLYTIMSNGNEICAGKLPINSNTNLSLIPMTEQEIIEICK